MHQFIPSIVLCPIIVLGCAFFRAPWIVIWMLIFFIYLVGSLFFIINLLGYEVGQRKKIFERFLIQMFIYLTTFAICILEIYIIQKLYLDKADGLVQAVEKYRELHGRYPTQEDVVTIADQLGIHEESNDRFYYLYQYDYFIPVTGDGKPEITVYNPIFPDVNCNYDFKTKEWFCRD